MRRVGGHYSAAVLDTADPSEDRLQRQVVTLSSILPAWVTRPGHDFGAP